MGTNVYIFELYSKRNTAIVFKKNLLQFLVQGATLSIYRGCTLHLDLMFYQLNSLKCSTFLT